MYLHNKKVLYKYISMGLRKKLFKIALLLAFESVLVP